MADQQDAIHMDVSDVDEQDEQQQETTGHEAPALSPREEALARIDQVNYEWIEQSNQGYAETEGQIPTAERRDDAPEPAPASTIRVKIDGEELELPLAEVVKGYQKDSTASRRMEEAATRLREVEAREQRLQELATAANQQAATPDLSDDPDEQVTELAGRIVHAMMEGEAETAVQDLVGLLKHQQQGRGGQTSETDIQQAVQQALQVQALDREYGEARELFVQEHADMNDNPKLAGMVNEVYFRELEAGRRPKAAAIAAVNEVRQFVQELTGSPGKTISTSKAERKQSYETITPASGRVAATVAKEDDSTLAIIASIKAGRGQA